MSKDQFSSFMQELNDNHELRASLQISPDLDAAVSVAREAGFDVNESDWRDFYDSQVSELSDEDLESLAGGGTICMTDGVTFAGAVSMIGSWIGQC